MIRKRKHYSYLKDWDNFIFYIEYLRLIPKWWKLFGWKDYSWYLAKHDPDLLFNLNRWYEYYNFKDVWALSEYAPNLIKELEDARNSPNYFKR